MLARVGILQGAPFIQIKAHKQKRAIVDVVITEGVAVIRCRECLRFHRIKVSTILRDSHPMMDVR